MEENAQYNTDMNFTPHKLELRDVYVNTSMMRLGLWDKVGFHVLIARFFSTVEEEVGTLVFINMPTFPLHTTKGLLCTVMHYFMYRFCCWTGFYFC